MMKFFPPESLLDVSGAFDASAVNLSEIADLAIEESVESLWAYEGIVLPGGNVIVGRWWSPVSGRWPFLYL